MHRKSQQHKCSPSSQHTTAQETNVIQQTTQEKKKRKKFLTSVPRWKPRLSNFLATYNTILKPIPNIRLQKDQMLPTKRKCERKNVTTNSTAVTDSLKESLPRKPQHHWRREQNKNRNRKARRNTTTLPNPRQQQQQSRIPSQELLTNSQYETIAVSAP